MTQNPLERAKENKIIATNAVNDYYLKQFLDIKSQGANEPATKVVTLPSIIDRHTPPERELTRRFNAIGVQ